MADTSVLDALVTRNIGDIEAAVAHARELANGLFEEIAGVLEVEMGDAWRVEPDSEDQECPLWLARRDWIRDGGKSKTRDYGFNFNEKVGPSGEGEETWLSTLMNAGPEGATIAIYFWSDTFRTKRRWARLMLDQKGVVDKLLAAGFQQDDDKWLYLPFGLDAEQVAKGFEAGDMSAALEPVRNVSTIIKSSIKELEMLIARDRAFE